MKLETVQLALAFLERVQLTGGEVAAFTQVVTELQAMGQEMSQPTFGETENETTD